MSEKENNENNCEWFIPLIKNNQAFNLIPQKKKT